MTVAVAVRKKRKTVLVADSLVHFGGQRFPAHGAKLNKIHRIGDTLVAWAGWSLYAEMLTAHLAISKDTPRLHSEADVFAFFVDFWRAMQANYTLLASARALDGNPFASLDSTFLMCNASGIYRIAGDMDVTSFRQYSAIGSGSQYALGAMRVLYATPLDAEEVGRRAVQVGIDFDVYCGGPIDCERIDSDDDE